MSKARLALPLLLLALFQSLPVLAKAPVGHYIAADSIDVKALLGNPPAPASAADKADIRASLDAQAARTHFQIARVRTEVDLSPTAFDTVLGPDFTPQHYPLTFKLLNNAASDGELISTQAKTIWHRPRPPLQDAAIHPVVPLPATGSYPSGHAMRGAIWAVLLVHLDPKARNPLLERGSQIGYDRVIAGVHFTTDVLAGQRLGIRIAHRMLDSLAFQRDLAHARVEFPRQ